MGFGYSRLSKTNYTIDYLDLWEHCECHFKRYAQYMTPYYDIKLHKYRYRHLYGIGFSSHEDIINGFSRKPIVIFSDKFYINPVKLLAWVIVPHPKIQVSCE